MHSPNKTMSLSGRRSKTSDKKNDNRQILTYLATCFLMLSFTPIYFDTNIFFPSVKFKVYNGFQYTRSKFSGQQFFSNCPESRLSRPEIFSIVPIPFVPSRKIFGTVPFVPRDGTNGIFRDSGLSRRSLF